MTYEPAPPMPHREKTARLALVAMLVSYIPFFIVAATAPPAPQPNLYLIGWFAAVSALRVFILGVGHLGFRLQSPQDARAKADERDKAIDRWATTIAYYVLMAGALATGCFMPFYTGGWDIVGASIAVVVLAEIVRCLMVVVGYRREAHG